MRCVVLVLGLLLALPFSSSADADSGLKKLNSLNGTKGWQGVGRLNIGSNAFCTGTLIAPDIVLTAAHCLFDPHSGARESDERMEFLAGWSGGRAAAQRRIKRSVIHPEYEYGAPKDAKRVATDLAVIQLDQPIRHPSIKPFSTVTRDVREREVRVVSYARERSDAPSIQRSCQVLDAHAGVYVTSCDVDFGASGAPVFLMDRGIPKVMAVVSAMAEMDQKKISLTAGLSNRLAQLLEIVDRTDGVFQRPVPEVKRLNVGQKSVSGARFLKPGAGLKNP